MTNIPPRGIPPNSMESEFLKSAFPCLLDREWTKTGERTGRYCENSYNCYAWSLCRDDVGWLDKQVDMEGNNNGALEVEDFDDYYQRRGYAICGTTVNDCVPQIHMRKIALFSLGNRVLHAAKEADDGGWWESKMGQEIKIMHRLEQLEGGAYGNVCRCYYKSSTHANLRLERKTTN